jgi:hypothetical protein
LDWRLLFDLRANEHQNRVHATIAREVGLTGFEIDQVLYQVLHQLILSDHVALERHELADDSLVVLREVEHVLRHAVLTAVKLLELGLNGVHVAGMHRRRVLGRRAWPRSGEVGGFSKSCWIRCRLARCGSLALRRKRERQVGEPPIGLESLTLICSSDSFMSARKLGCLNSHVCIEYLVSKDETRPSGTSAHVLRRDCPPHPSS